jgi:hypothetical protein
MWFITSVLHPNKGQLYPAIEWQTRSTPDDSALPALVKR